MSHDLSAVYRGLPVVIWDLDNCLSDDAERSALIDWRLEGAARWGAYHAACGNDAPGNLRLFRLLHNNLSHLAPTPAVPVFFTARPESVREPTEAWLRKQLAVRLQPWHLLMRADGDERSSTEIKREMLDRIGWTQRSGVQVVCAFDDRPEVVAMYRAEGLQASILAIHEHNFHAPPPPPDDADIVSLADLRRFREPGVVPPQACDGDHGAPACADPGCWQRPAPPATPADLLRAAADLFERRNREYANSYRRCGPVLQALFPDGLPDIRGDVGAAERFGVFMMLIAKIQRYALTLGTGGHEDSAADAAVYSAMLQELTREAIPF
jgi:hypothetical protein